MLSETNHKALLSDYLSGNISKDELRSKMYANASLFGVLFIEDKSVTKYKYSSSIDGDLYLTDEEFEARPEEDKMVVRIVMPD